VTKSSRCPPTRSGATPLSCAAIDRGLLARAVELYRDDLMPGFHLPECHDFDEWLEEQRASLHEAGGGVLALAQNLEAGNNGTLNEIREEVTRLIKPMNACFVARCKCSTGSVIERRAGRLRRVYAAPQKDLDADPSPETVRMGEALRAACRCPDLPPPAVSPERLQRAA
jgi:hypothetical protein